MRCLKSVGACFALCLAVACRDRAPDDSSMHRVEPAPVQPANAEPAPATNEPAAAPAAQAEPEAPAPQPSAAVRDMPRIPPHARAEEAAPAKPAPKPAAAKPAESKPIAAKPAATKPAKPAPAKPAPAAPAPVAPEPVAAAPEPPPAPSEPPPPPPPAAKPATRVVIPNTARVRVEVPAGLQRWLDADTRMQPWLNKVMGVIDNCYGNVVADSPNAAGTITFRVTMHENARPDPDIQSLPGALSGVVTCATGQLMRARMPLFTGTEGESYVVKVKFGG